MVSAIKKVQSIEEVKRKKKFSFRARIRKILPGRGDILKSLEY